MTIRNSKAGDSKTGNIVRNFSIEELQDAANLMRGYNLVALCAAGSGHAGGTLSMMDITAALYLRAADHDPEESCVGRPGQDYLVGGSQGAGSLYGPGHRGILDIRRDCYAAQAGLALSGPPALAQAAGCRSFERVVRPRAEHCRGHGAGRAARRQAEHKIFCLMGDGEQQEGQVWEAAMEAGHFHLDNIVAVVDCNRLQIDGWVKDVMQVEPLDAKYASFGWEVLRIDGHDMRQVVDALREGKGREGEAGGDSRRYHQGQRRELYGEPAGLARQSSESRGAGCGAEGAGAERAASRWTQLLEKAEEFQTEASRKLEAKMPRFSRDYWWNAGETMKVKMEPTRKGFGQSLAAVR